MRRPEGLFRLSAATIRDGGTTNLRTFIPITYYLVVVANRRRVFKQFACSILIISYSRGTRTCGVIICKVIDNVTAGQTADRKTRVYRSWLSYILSGTEVRSGVRRPRIARGCAFASHEDVLYNIFLLSCRWKLQSTVSDFFKWFNSDRKIF